MSNLASFAPYTPPPDDPAYTSTPNTTLIRPWFPSHAGSSNETDASYQSGGIPTFGTSATGGGDPQAMLEGQQSQWETSHGLRVDLLAAVAYLLGPVSALALLVLETKNDYVRFHAYQSALLITPLLVIRFCASLVQAPAWMQTLSTFSLILASLGMSCVAYTSVARTGLVHHHLPGIGAIADRWLADE
ncbi:hypothetical protein Hypma_015508 [Hypsizygus marmoreus]|uniref:Uncharacterized protein n=1 Tax=Hypsizygus marmoreus TaxID=39966 RepID=A0A369K2I9_HYPMA|nr:hypothetical protein Hypma_015508 [Hypsizygus marmoreus]